MPKLSLRTLAIGFSAICVYLALALPPAAQNKRAFDKIVHIHGAKFRPDFVGPYWMRLLLPAEYTTTIDYAQFDSVEFDDSDLKDVLDAATALRLPIREIRIIGTSVSAAALIDAQNRIPTCIVTLTQ